MSFPILSTAFVLRQGRLTYNSAIATSRHVTYRYSTSNKKSSTTIERSFKALSSSFSSFEAPPPPSSNGEAVYNDIDLCKSNATEISTSALRNNDPDAVFVVTGASRGIGLQHVKSLMERTHGHIVACCRSIDEKDGALFQYLSSLSLNDKKRINAVELDVEDQKSIDALVVTMKEKLLFDRVDVLYNVAGLLGDGTNTPGPERSISKIDRDWVDKTLGVNLVGPLMLSQALAPFMKTTQPYASKKELNKTKAVRNKSIIVNISARVGSISDNQLGGWYSYRMSKAALNQVTRTMAHELRRQGTWTIALHPGTTDTDLSKPFQRNVKEGRLFPVEFTVKQLLDVIDSMEDQHSGGFFDWSGKALPF